MSSSAICAVLLLLIMGIGSAARAQTAAEKDLAASYAPIFHQVLGEDPRGDYITNFDFDGDWVGTNNWANAANKKFKLPGYVYYSVAETATHFFIHYAVFHARDYKGGERKGVIYSDLLGLGAKILSKGNEPTGKLAEAAIAHENDMEGALIVVEKASGNVAYVETLHHNEFSRYVPESAGGLGTVTAGVSSIAETAAAGDGRFRSSGRHVELYIEPKGHGIEAWGSQPDKSERGYLVYTFRDRAEDPESAAEGMVGYQLVPIATTLWPKAAIKTGNSTFASFKDFGTLAITIRQGGKDVARKVTLGVLASAFDGKVGGVNMARPPWGWFSNDRRDDPPGLWFFDPAKIVKRDYALGDSFSTVYVKTPFWAVK